MNQLLILKSTNDSHSENDSNFQLENIFIQPPVHENKKDNIITSGDKNHVTAMQIF